LRADGTVVAWGLDTSDQTSVPEGLANVVAIAAAGNHCLALCSNRTVVAWGDNYDALGDFSGQSFVPFDLTNVVAIGAGDYHSLAVKADGSVVAWGSDSDGQVDVPANLTNAVAIVGGNAHTVALNADSTIAAWGNDWNGQCDFPPGVSNVVYMAAGYSHTILLQGDHLAPPKLVRPTRHAGQFSLAVLTIAGKNYTLEYKTSLSAPNWTGIVTVRGNGAQQLLTDPAAVGLQRFYRVRQW
jgi:alpha-tubulin suppressor-like RCC1 family protein